jgi:hypothetical protein
MKKSRLSIILSFAASAVLLNQDGFAGIGYTPEQCERKYGKEISASSDDIDFMDFLIKETSERHFYGNARYKVKVTFDSKGKAMEALYVWPLGKDPTGEEIKTIIELSSNKWKIGTNDHGRKATITDDGLELKLSGGGPRARFLLEITTAAYRSKLEKENEELFK